jgi:tritrans,polycis-undecaprenyl-diphosphate synthase [geranylgeranyl-diphosphate specific]
VSRRTSIRHLGLIPDGNRRFARSHGKPAWQGHLAGVKTMHKFIRWVFEDWGIPVLTIYGFSANNFSRPAFEVSKLMKIIKENVEQISTDPAIARNGVRVRFIGRLHLMPPAVRDAIKTAERLTAGNAKFSLNIALAYDGQAEIADAVAAGARTEKEIESRLYLAGLPQPDLIIRTSGEQRLSGFLLWGSSYAEFAFCRKNWPAFGKADLRRMIDDYNRRNRRFGH